jgi:hypothetical protein
MAPLAGRMFRNSDRESQTNGLSSSRTQGRKAHRRHTSFLKNRKANPLATGSLLPSSQHKHSMETVKFTKCLLLELLSSWLASIANLATPGLTHWIERLSEFHHLH